MHNTNDLFPLYRDKKRKLEFAQGSGRKELINISSLQFTRSVASNSLRPHGLQHARPPCLSPTPGAYSNSCLLRWWCHPAISCPAALFSFCPQSFPASGNFPVSWLFASDDQNTGATTSASVVPMSIQAWFPLKSIGLISLLSKGLSGIFSSTTVQRHQFFGIVFFKVQLSQPYSTTGKTVVLHTVIIK